MNLVSIDTTVEPNRSVKRALGYVLANGSSSNSTLRCSHMRGDVKFRWNVSYDDLGGAAKYVDTFMDTMDAESNLEAAIRLLLMQHRLDIAGIRDTYGIDCAEALVKYVINEVSDEFMC